MGISRPRIADEIKKRRRLDLGLDSPADRSGMPPRYTWRTKEQLRQQELNGGIVIVGRPTWKEFMTGLKNGWTDPLDIVDHDEELSKELEADGRFDEPDEPMEGASASPAQMHNSQFYASLQAKPSLPPSFPAPVVDVPATIPALPPILLVSFVDYVGIKLVPHMIWDWMNRRHHVRAGAEAGYRLVMAHTRPHQPPSNQTSLLRYHQCPHARHGRGFRQVHGGLLQELPTIYPFRHRAGPEKVLRATPGQVGCCTGN